MNPPLRKPAVSALVLATLLSPACGGLAGPEKRNVVMITIDTLRADHLPIHGYKGVGTPVTDSIAADGVVFENAIASAPLTLPSHTTIMTGTNPFFHGVRNNGNFYASESLSTAAEMFKAAGYDTAAFVGSYVLDSRFGLDQGFDVYDDDMIDGRQKHSAFEFKDRIAENVINRVLKWLDGRAEVARPFFLWVHLFDPHKEYEPPEPFASKYGDSLYDGEIAYTDFWIGILINRLKQKGLYDDALVVVTADHGESLGEHGESTHSVFVYNATTWVPLIIKFPGGRYAGGRVSDTAAHVDLLPTLLDALDLDHAVGRDLTADIQGDSLIPLVEGRKSSSARAAYSESYLPKYYYNWSPPESIRTDDYRFINLPMPELYDMREDPAELRNLYDDEKAVSEKYAEMLAGLKRTHGRGEMAESTREMDAETLAKLKSLGYIQGGANLSGSPSGASGPDPKEMIHIREEMNVIHAMINRKEYEGAFMRSEAILSEHEDNLQARNCLATIYTKMKRIDKAIEQYEALKEFDPGFLAAYLGLCRLYTKEQVDFEKAERELDAAFAIAPEETSLWVVKGDLEQERGELENSVASYEKALSLGEQSPALFVGLGSARNKQDKLAEAEALLTKAIYVDNENAEAFYNLGFVHNRMGKVELAKKHYRLAIEHDPENPRSHTNLGSILTNQKAYGEAEGLFREALRIKPDHVEALYNMGTVCLHLNRPGDAIPYLEKAVGISPGLVFAYRNLALAHERLGNKGKTFETYKRLTEVVPGAPMPWYNMARIAASQDRGSEAQEYLTTAISKGGEEFRKTARNDPAFEGLTF